MTIDALEKAYENAIQTQNEMIFAEQDYLAKKPMGSFHLTKEGKEHLAKIKNANRDFYIVFDKYEMENGLVYTDKTWITKIYGDFVAFEEKSEGALELARRKLLEKLSKMNGITIIDEKSGVKSVMVRTPSKDYYYSIHAYYCVEKIGEEEYIGMFGGTHKRDITRNGCQGCVYKNTYSVFRDKWQDAVKYIKEAK